MTEEMFVFISFPLHLVTGADIKFKVSGTSDYDVYNVLLPHPYR